MTSSKIKWRIRLKLKIFEIFNLDQVTIFAQQFDTMTQVQYKVYVWITLLKTFQIISNLFGGQKFVIVFGDDHTVMFVVIIELSN